MMRLSEYSFLLEKESARLKKLREGSVMGRPGTAALSSGCARIIRIPHDERYLMTKQQVTNNAISSQKAEETRAHRSVVLSLESLCDLTPV